MKPGQLEEATPLYTEIVYGDTTLVVRSLEEWCAAPQDGVLVVRQVMAQTYRLINQPERHYAVRLAYKDYYWMARDGLVDEGNGKRVPTDLPPGAVKRGAWTTREAMNAAYNAVLADPEVRRGD